MQQDEKSQPDPDSLLELVRKERWRKGSKLLIWYLLALPIAGVATGFICSGGSGSIFTNETHYACFLFVMFLYLLAHLLFIALLNWLVKLEADAILRKMKQINFYPSGQETPIPISMSEHGRLVALQYDCENDFRFPTLEPVLSAISEYYEACVVNKLFPYNRWLTYLEGAMFCGFFVVCLITLPTLIAMRFSFDIEFSAFQQASMLCISFAIYLWSAWIILRQLAMVKALEALLSQPLK